MIQSYKELIVWQKSILLVTEIYSLTESFPRSEMFGIVNQMRRASISIPSNIAEGYGRKSSKEYIQFYSIAYGSSLELETQIIISKNLKFTEEDHYKIADTLLQEVQKMLHTMIIRLKSRV